MSDPAGDAYTAVIFTAQRIQNELSATDGYDEMAAQMDELVMRQPGHRGVDSVRNESGLGITVSYWDNEAAAQAWKEVVEHKEAQRLGRDRWYSWYEVRVASVTRQYSFHRPLTIFHLAMPADWAAGEAAGEYTMSTRGVTLEQEGFIHCSYAHQLEATANRFYADVEELAILSVDTPQLDAEVIVEPPAPGAPEAFPHVYGPIPVDCVSEVRVWKRAANAVWAAPPPETAE